MVRWGARDGRSAESATSGFARADGSVSSVLRLEDERTNYEGRASLLR